jgi:hypothetical protein
MGALAFVSRNVRARDGAAQARTPELASHSYDCQVDELLERIRDEKSLEAEMIRSILGHTHPRSSSRSTCAS